MWDSMPQEVQQTNIGFQNVADLVERQFDSRIINEFMKHPGFCVPCPWNKNAVFTLSI